LRRNDFTYSLFDTFPTDVVASHSRADKPGNRLGAETDWHQSAARTPEQHAAIRAEREPRGLAEFR
jgi:hypothetical protein